MPKLFSVIRVCFIFPVLFLVGCSGEPETGPVDIRWDREICVRCAMAVSDHNYSAQVRSKADGKNRVYKFDDIGCATLWLEDKPWQDAPATEIWVTDHRNGKWLNARTANYVTGKITPMGYGLGAQPEKTEDSLDFSAAKVHVQQVEATINVHGGSYQHPESAGE